VAARQLFAEAGDGSVTLRWKASVDFDAKDTWCIMATAGEYLAAGRRSTRECPGVLVTAAKRQIYYFAVAAYDAAGPLLPGRFPGGARASDQGPE
jgi:hypothetical protein